MEQKTLLSKLKKEFPKGMDLRIILRIEGELKKTISEVFDELEKKDILHFVTPTSTEIRPYYKISHKDWVEFKQELEKRIGLGEK